MNAVVETRGLRKAYGKIEAVRGIDLEVQPGEIFGFLGPNGAGKTTTISILCTLVRKTAGEARVAGVEVDEDPAEIRRRIGLVFQDPSLDDQLTARENLELHGQIYGVPANVRRQRIDELLQVVELADRAKSLVRTFSGGMKRRLEIARGVLHHPQVLFLDEPTLGLDPQSRNQMWTHVQNLNQSDGVTVFLTTHYMDEADRVAHRIAIIDHGRIVAIGSSAELKQRTNTDSLEAAYLALTGTDIRDETVGATDRMRQAAQMWRRR